ncbi:MAG: class I SAM-dependent methyltransferase [Methanoculleus sp.]|uniref:class I SAM-dependent methyltransferase n=1 Tax=unclassified Methanoculleus TaxID=2619537 RepID=UPI0025EA6975|nr:MULTISPECIES: class I SAM-dependent methyltransferase [unclassified Methanoculleus]MCK9307197.1 class I SAM-dependent methyltransferase [Methanoculleus sp.]MDD4313611.1 class I SAM-dependent methyltransferase [Methanoculleus sp.]MDD4470806.1 class I SAM-dependent methyltransferase [Methanoculleus sp.]
MQEPHHDAELWDRIWGKEQITSDYSIRYLDFMTEIERALPAGSTVCEAGCGTGQTLRIFSPRHRTIGLDISANALRIAKRSCDAPLQGDIFRIPLRNGSCDLVYNSGVIEHFPHPANVAAVAEMARVTRRGGEVIVIVPNTFCLWYKIGKEVAYRMKRFEFGYEEDYSPIRLRATLEDAGIEVGQCFGLQATPVLATNDREILPFPARRKLARLEKYFPLREYYSYAVGIVGRKE